MAEEKITITVTNPNGDQWSSTVFRDLREPGKAFYYEMYIQQDWHDDWQGDIDLCKVIPNLIFNEELEAGIHQ